MIRSIGPSAPPLPPVSAPAARGAEAAMPWFDPEAGGANVRIGADLSPASRGLRVDEHAARVLDHLCAAPVGRA